MANAYLGSAMLPNRISPIKASGLVDVFLFFGLFADEGTKERHHRFYGYMRVAETHRIAHLDEGVREQFESLKHPHMFGIRSANNTIYRGEGAAASRAPDELRLTRVGGPLSRWTVPAWLRERGLSYHGKPARWIGDRELNAVARGQEFVCDIGDDLIAHAWVDSIIRWIKS